jgi:hypothetical protein
MLTLLRLGPDTWRAPVAAPERHVIGDARYEDWYPAYAEDRRRGHADRAEDRPHVNGHPAGRRGYDRTTRPVRKDNAE